MTKSKFKGETFATREFLRTYSEHHIRVCYIGEYPEVYIANYQSEMWMRWPMTSKILVDKLYKYAVLKGYSGPFECMLCVEGLYYKNWHFLELLEPITIISKNGIKRYVNTI